MTTLTPDTGVALGKPRSGERHRARRWTILALVVVLIAGLAAGGWALFVRDTTSSTENNAITAKVSSTQKMLNDVADVWSTGNPALVSEVYGPEASLREIAAGGLGESLDSMAGPGVATLGVDAIKGRVTLYAAVPGFEMRFVGDPVKIGDLITSNFEWSTNVTDGAGTSVMTVDPSGKVVTQIIVLASPFRR